MNCAYWTFESFSAILVIIVIVMSNGGELHVISPMLKWINWSNAVVQSALVTINREAILVSLKKSLNILSQF